ncbi:hypothetical protein [Oligoflexus tunisiensis]|uniref:hypothetical protein n=1 Tax=Oligoflexus tunisiensis TaxID=708132 RepID=UPI000B1FD973|nr:hypothetical protein [Oligoflexus tunisiensis]
MEKKPVLPFAAVLAIAAGWLFVTRGGHQDPIPLDLSPSRSGTGTSVTVQAEADPASDEEREQRLAELFQEEDSAWPRHADIHRIHCEGQTCIIEASPKGDPALLRSQMENLLREHPWLGTRMDTSASEGPADTLTFAFHREAAPSTPP